MALNYDYIIQFVGLDNSGKTTILRNFDQDNKSLILPTTNVNLFGKKMGNNQLKVIFLDCSGNGRFRKSWKNNYKNINGLIYVIDIKNKNRLKKDKELWRKIFKNKILSESKISVLILFNKIDDEENIQNDIDLIKEFWEIDKLNISGLKYFYEKVSGKEKNNVTESIEQFLKFIKNN